VGEAGWLDDFTGAARAMWKRFESIINHSNPMSSAALRINARGTA